MLVNADFTRPAIVTPRDYRWVASPQAGVERVMLDRVGGETARATSIVRYAPGSHFPAHGHARGEEIFVLSGTFSEGSRHYPAGSYLRNPPGSSHQPSSATGALLFVKLRQLPPSETEPVRIDTGDARLWSVRSGRQVCELFRGEHETVVLERIASGQGLLASGDLGAEILVVAGALQAGAAAYPRGTWLRLPPGDPLKLEGSVRGATVYVKTGHLAHIPQEAEWL